MKEPLIGLTFRQLMILGLYIGHLKQNSRFLSSWFFFLWREKIFVIDMIRSIYGFKITKNALSGSVKHRRPIWFVTKNKYYGPYISRYAGLCGECYNCYSWIAGTATNYKNIFRFFSLMLYYIKKKIYIFRNLDKKKMIAYQGFVNYRRRYPGCSFLPTVVDAVTAIRDLHNGRVSTISIIDSNIRSDHATIPIPGNDDSLLCINFVSFFIAKNLLVLKAYKLKRFFCITMQSKSFNDIRLRKLIVILNDERALKYERLEKMLDRFNYFLNKVVENSKYPFNYNIEIKRYMTILYETRFSFTNNRFHKRINVIP